MVTNKSILGGVRGYLGYLEDETSFDTELIPLINMALNILKDIGVGKRDVFVVNDITTYDDFLGDYSTNPEFVSAMTFVNLKVKTIFDPTTSATVMKALTDTCDEILWRLCQ